MINLMKENKFALSGPRGRILITPFPKPPSGKAFRTLCKTYNILSIKPPDGFTFIQALITIIIASILLVIAIPDFSTYLKVSRLKSAAEHFYSDMQFARSKTTEGSDIYVNLSPGSPWCYGLNQSSSCNCTQTNSCKIDGTEKKVTSAEFPSIAMSTFGFSNNTFRFNHLQGTSNVSEGKVVFYIEEKSIDITINNAGRVLICSNTVSGYQPCT